MKTSLTGFAATAAMLCVLAGSVHAASEASPLPGVDTWNALSDEAREAQRDAVKRVMLERMIRLKEDRHRLTPDNSAHCARMAQELGAPAAFVHLLEQEAGHPPVGRDYYAHMNEMTRLLEVYGVDELQIRVFAEEMRCGGKEARSIAAWLPLKDVFLLVSKEVTLEENEVRSQLETLRDVYARMADVYSGIKNRAGAEAAADELLPLLEQIRPTAALRAALSRLEKDSVPLYVRIVGQARERLIECRTYLREANYYGSHRLAALDSLLSA